MSNPHETGRQRCPCGSGADYDTCCGRIHRGEARALTAEALMRSRYSAFAVGDEAYLLRSWQPGARPARVRFVPGQHWTRLEVVAAAGGPLDTEGTVEFVAHFERDGEARRLHEISRFTRHEGHWVYVGPVAADA
jgi:SEC-C motif-containing protein